MHTPETFNRDSVRERFAADSLQTASGPKIITMCFDRLDRDLSEALDAIERSDHFESNRALGHAQDLVSEMASMLDIEAWEHAGALLALYDYLLRVLTVANTAKAPSLVREAQQIVAELGAAFRSAADQAPADSVASASATDASGFAPVESDRPRLSVQA